VTALEDARAMLAAIDGALEKAEAEIGSLEDRIADAAPLDRVELRLALDTATRREELLDAERKAAEQRCNELQEYADRERNGKILRELEAVRDARMRDLWSAAYSANDAWQEAMKAARNVHDFRRGQMRMHSDACLPATVNLCNVDGTVEILPQEGDPRLPQMSREALEALASDEVTR
jgi:hypothetical protein